MSTFLFGVLCAAGCGFHIYELGSRYFSYATSSLTSFVVPERILMPSSSLCIRYTDIVDYPRLQRETGLSVYYPAPVNITRDILWDAKSALTVSQIFNYSPPINEFFHSCKVRFPDDYRIETYTGNDCLNTFKMSKYYAQEYVCYRLDPRDSLMMKYKISATALSDPNVLYNVRVNATAFARLAVLKLVLHDRPTPTHSFSLAPWYDVFFNPFSGIYSNDYITLTYIKMIFNLLPYPYDTNCRDYASEGLQNAVNCIEQCLQENIILQFGKVPFSGIIDEPLNLKPISPYDIVNETRAKELDAIETFCKGVCKKATCKLSYSITRMVVTYDRAPTTVVVKVPPEPFVIIAYKPAVPLVEFITIVLSCFGTWFGVSILGLNPVTILRKRKKPTGKARKVIPEQHHLNAIDNIRLVKVERGLNSVESELKRFRRQQKTILSYLYDLKELVYINTAKQSREERQIF